MTISVHQFPCLSDNYGFLLHDSDSGQTACIDTPDGAEYLAQAQAKGWQITAIWNTHWHPDHAGGNEVIKAATGCKIFAPQEVERISPIDHVVGQGDTVMLGENEAEVIDVGGHTKGHIAYHLAVQNIAFVGDALFALGCGRMFEGTPGQFWSSLSRLKTLPEDTLIYCAHEYTMANATFALHADPDNSALQEYVQWIKERREAGLPTVPFRLKRELQTNPFLRADDLAMKARWGGSEPQETFAALRSAKDAFKG